MEVISHIENAHRIWSNSPRCMDILVEGISVLHLCCCRVTYLTHRDHVIRVNRVIHDQAPRILQSFSIRQTSATRSGPTLRPQRWVENSVNRCLQSHCQGRLHYNILQNCWRKSTTYPAFSFSLVCFKGRSSRPAK